MFRKISPSNFIYASNWSADHTLQGVFRLRLWIGREAALNHFIKSQSSHESLIIALISHV